MFKDKMIIRDHTNPEKKTTKRKTLTTIKLHTKKFILKRLELHQNKTGRTEQVHYNVTSPMFVTTQTSAKYYVGASESFKLLFKPIC